MRVPIDSELALRKGKMKRTNLESSKWFPLFLLALILLFIYNMLGNFTSVTGEIGRFLTVVSPLLYGILFSYFLYIPHSLFEKMLLKINLGIFQKKARLFATLLTFVVIIVALSVIISFIIPVLVTSLLDLATSIPAYMAFITNLIESIPDDTWWGSVGIVENLAFNAEDMLGSVINAASIEQVALGIFNFANELLNLVLGLVISLYILFERDRIVNFLRGLSKAVFKKDRRRARVNRYMYRVNSVMLTFIASKGLDSIINFVTVTAILLIFDVPYAVLLGIMAGVFNFIPYLGSLIAVISISLITIITGGLNHALQVVIPLFIFQQLDGNFIDPKIMKSSLKISPILVIIAVVIGAAYFGVVGMFLAVPIAVIIKQILIEYIESEEEPDIPEENIDDIMTE